jgi:hypothetical protein
MMDRQAESMLHPLTYPVSLVILSKRNSDMSIDNNDTMEVAPLGGCCCCCCCRCGDDYMGDISWGPPWVLQESRLMLLLMIRDLIWFPFLVL